MTTTLFENTKLCCRMFTGCTNPDCSYAHTLNEIRWGLEYGMEDVFFQKPADANMQHSSKYMPEPNETYFPRFLISFDDEEEVEPASLSITQHTEIVNQWQLSKLKDAYWTRLWALQLEYQRLSDHMGEMDMDICQE